MIVGRLFRAGSKKFGFLFTRLRLLYGYRVWGIEYISREIIGSFHSVHLLRIYGASIGRSVVIHPQLVIHDARDNYSNLSIGSNVSISRGVFLDLSAELRISDNVGIGMCAMLFTHRNFSRSSALAKVYPSQLRPICICHDVMIGARAIILPGVTVNPYSVVAPGAVVTTDVPTGSLVVGNPARVLSRIEGVLS